MMTDAAAKQYLTLANAGADVIEKTMADGRRVTFIQVAVGIAAVQRAYEAGFREADRQGRDFIAACLV